MLVRQHKVCTNSEKAVRHSHERNKSFVVEMEEELQQMTKQLYPSDFATEFRGIGPYEFFLPIQRIAQNKYLTPPSASPNTENPETLVN